MGDYKICKLFLIYHLQKQGLLSSFEDGLSRVLDAITPKRGTGSAGPRKVKVKR